MNFDDLQSKYPDLPETIVAAYERAANSNGDIDAVIEGDDRITYAELWSRSEIVARSLASLGLAKGDHIGVCVGNGPLWVELFLGILRAGAVCVPINTRLKPPEIAYQLQSADVKLLFTVDRLLSIDFIEVFRTICSGVDTILPDAALPELANMIVIGGSVPAGCIGFGDFLEEGSNGSLPEEIGVEDAALIQFTSGTTSAPKGVLLSHRNMVTDAYFVGRRMGVSLGDRYLSARPFFHVAGSTLSVILSAVHRTTLVTMKRFIAEDALRLLEQHDCAYTSGNDTMYLMMLNSAEFGEHQYALRGGWAAASPSIMQRIVDEFGAAQTVEAYGLSEASPNIATSDYSDPVKDRIDGWMKTHPGLEVRVADPDTDKPVPNGEKGEIQVKGWNVMQGYYNQPKATAAVTTKDGFLRTGDVGIHREDGYLRFTGRLKDIIRVGGENVAPSDIENTLHQHPKIKQAVAFGVPDPRLIEVPCVYVMPRAGADLSEDEISAWTKDKLAGFKTPKYYAIVANFDEFGMTASSKIQKRFLVDHAIRKFGLGGASGNV